MGLSIANLPVVSIATVVSMVQSLALVNKICYGGVLAFIGALYVDQGLEPCIVLCQVCFFPRLKVCRQYFYT